MKYQINVKTCLRHSPSELWKISYICVVAVTSQNWDCRLLEFNWKTNTDTFRLTWCQITQFQTYAVLNKITQLDIFTILKNSHELLSLHGWNCVRWKWLRKGGSGAVILLLIGFSVLESEFQLDFLVYQYI